MEINKWNELIPRAQTDFQIKTVSLVNYPDSTTLVKHQNTTADYKDSSTSFQITDLWQAPAVYLWRSISIKPPNKNHEARGDVTKWSKSALMYTFDLLFSHICSQIKQRSGKSRLHKAEHFWGERWRVVWECFSKRNSLSNWNRIE